MSTNYSERFPEISDARWELLDHYTRLLTTAASSRGLVGFDDATLPIEIARSLLLLDVLNSGRFIDVGSGAGLPGIPLAIASGTSGTFIERKQRACRFLETALRELQLSGEVICRSAEDAAADSLRESADTVVARAVAPPVVALQITAPLCRVGGRVVLTSKAPGERGPDFDVPEELGTGPFVLATLDRGIDLVQHVLIIDKLRPSSPEFPPRPKRRKA